MSDLSNLLGAVYGDHSPDAAPVRREPSADQRGPEWSSESPLGTSAPSPVAVPVAPVEAVPMPTLAQTSPEMSDAPKPAWTSSPEPAPAAPTVVSAPVSGSFWTPGDDDIFPLVNAAKKSKKK